MMRNFIVSFAFTKEGLLAVGSCPLQCETFPSYSFIQSELMKKQEINSTIAVINIMELSPQDLHSYIGG